MVAGLFGNRVTERACFAWVLALPPLLGGCGTDENLATCSFTVRQSVGQLHVTRATPNSELVLVDAAGNEVARATTDAQGSLVFRKLTPGKGYSLRNGEATVACALPLEVRSIENSKPSQSFYDSQKLAAGSGYIQVRDGTTLAIYVTLPGPPDKGPYPAVVNYSGYSPAQPGAPLGDFQSLCGSLPVLCDAPNDPSAMIAALNGYATVGVNMRGTGCSGGAYDFFEPLQLLDGYDVIETVAAQSWVLGHKVGMTGISYPGITQLFVAKLHPPSLAAITPLSVIGNTATTLLPGGIFNDGFALEWATNVLDSADPYGQGWERARVDAGDTTCQENQLLHSQKVDLVKIAFDNPYYTDEVAGPVNPTGFVDQIEVPVFLASAWEDEQTGPYFFTLLDKFKNARSKRFTVYNGVHPDAFAPGVLVEWKAFLDIYVAKKPPSVDPQVRSLAPFLFQQIFGVSVPLPPDRWGSVTSVEAAQAKWESEPTLRAIFESGAGDPNSLGAPVGTFELAFERWPPVSTDPRRFYFQPNGTLADTAPTAASAASSFELDPAAGQRGILASGDVWPAKPDYAWRQPDAGKAVVFESAPLAENLTMLGTGSVDIWLRSNVADADLEVNLSEVRPDGQEMYVQSGWLRASMRALTPSATALWPELTMREADVKPLVAGEWVEARLGIPGFSHVFRQGSRIRIAIDTPGDSRARWRFRLKEFATRAVHTIGHDSTHSSSVVLPVLAGATAPAALPPCPSLRGQQCRTHSPYTNEPAE